MTWADSAIDTLLIHAILVLGACALVCDGVKSLYDEKTVRAGLPPQDITVPFLESTAASNLRGDVTKFARLLFYFYCFLAALIVIFEYGIIPHDIKFALEWSGSKVEWQLDRIVFIFGTTFHLAIVVMVAGIVYRMANIRDSEARQRWRRWFGAR
jgi:hypothetical protein